jgi:hypothetical protein
MIGGSVVDVIGVVRSLLEVDVTRSDRVGVEAVLADVGRVVSWAEHLRVSAARRLEELAEESPSIVPGDVLAMAGRTGRRDADQIGRRAATLSMVPQLEAGLGDGSIAPGHVDVMTRTLRSLEPADRKLLADQGSWLAGVARRCTPEEFAVAVRRRINQIRTEDGVARFERQRRNTRLRHWVDRDSGMVCLHGEFDPETGLSLVRRLERSVEWLFHDAPPPTCPTEPDARQQHLAALALVALCSGRGSMADSTELVIHIDHRTLSSGLHEHSHIDAGSDVELPVETIRRLGCAANIVPVVVDSRGVVLQLGRTQRLANRAQRRALRAMHPVCAIPGCHVRFDHCVPHHIHWWRRGGTTDLANMVPLCNRHHRAVHEGGWVLHLEPSTRSVTVNRPGIPP